MFLSALDEIAENCKRQLGATGNRHDLTDISAKQAGDGSLAGQLHPLLPHIVENLQRNCCNKPGTVKGLVDCVHALSLLPVKFAVPETLEIGELDDAALGPNSRTISNK